MAEKARVRDDRVLRERLDSRARAERRKRLVEGQMSVRSDAAHEQIDASCLLDPRLVVRALFLQIGRVAVENVHVFGLDVDVAEKVVPHERVVAFGMVFRNADVFVHVERNDVGERDLSGLAHFDQLAIGPQRSGARGQTQYERAVRRFRMFVDPPGDMGGGPGRSLFVGRFDDDSHVLCLLIWFVSLFFSFLFSRGVPSGSPAKVAFLEMEREDSPGRKIGNGRLQLRRILQLNEYLDGLILRHAQSVV